VPEAPIARAHEPELESEWRAAPPPPPERRAPYQEVLERLEEIGKAIAVLTERVEALVDGQRVQAVRLIALERNIERRVVEAILGVEATANGEPVAEIAR
jgi:hypothetical protein